MGTTAESALPRDSAAEQQVGGATLAASAARGISELPGGTQNQNKKTMLRIRQKG